VAEHSDIGNSLLSSYFRSKLYPASVNKDQEKKEFEESMVKEIRATQGEDRPSVFNYRVWFDEAYQESLFEGCPPRETLNHHIHDIFDEFRSSFIDRVVFPRASRRHMSEETARLLGFTKITGEEYLRNYFSGGDLVGGSLELRQAWRYNDLTPRTYFCVGGKLFVVSMYAQEIFNTLIDLFEVSHRRRRFDLRRLDIDEEDDVWVYDYSSFTSNFTEQKHFLDRLADFCQGYPLVVFDVRHGKLQLDLGTYIRDYNAACNKLPEFVLGPALMKRLGIAFARYQHQRAGALGVYGNLASCTVLHGLFSMNLTGSVKKSSVVGDDGLLVIKTQYGELEEGEATDNLTHMTEIRNSLRLLGEISDTKFAVLGYPSSPYSSMWTYLKRSLIRHEDSLELLDQEHLINVALMLQEPHTLRRGNMSSFSGVSSLLVQVLNLLLRIHRQQTQVLDVELEAISEILNKTYSKFSLPKIGSLHGARVCMTGRSSYVEETSRKQESFFVDKIICCIPPEGFGFRLRRHPVEVLIEQHDWEQDPIKIPEMSMDSPRVDPSRLKLGDTFVSTSSKALGLAEKMSIVVKSPLSSRYCRCREDFEDFQRKLLSRSFSIVYEYTCIRDVPLHFVDILCY
jgi:hypothetical protein